jgi:hypothetical protein
MSGSDRGFPSADVEGTADVEGQVTKEVSGVPMQKGHADVEGTGHQGGFRSTDAEGTHRCRRDRSPSYKRMQSLVVLN